MGTTTAWLLRVFLPGLTAMVGAWSTMALSTLVRTIHLCLIDLNVCSYLPIRPGFYSIREIAKRYAEVVVNGVELSIFTLRTSRANHWPIAGVTNPNYNLCIRWFVSNTVGFPFLTILTMVCRHCCDRGKCPALWKSFVASF